MKTRIGFGISYSALGLYSPESNWPIELAKLQITLTLGIIIALPNS